MWPQSTLINAYSSTIWHMELLALAPEEAAVTGLVNQKLSTTHRHAYIHTQACIGATVPSWMLVSWVTIVINR